MNLKLGYPALLYLCFVFYICDVFLYFVFLVYIVFCISNGAMDLAQVSSWVMLHFTFTATHIAQAGSEILRGSNIARAGSEILRGSNIARAGSEILRGSKYCFSRGKYIAMLEILIEQR